MEMEVATTATMPKGDQFEHITPGLEKIGLKPNMTRQERRRWYRENKKRFNLPPWDELINMKAPEYGK